MSERQETRITSLPGLGEQHEITTAEGETLGVIHHAGGDREIVVRSVEDPDACRIALRLRAEDAARLAALLASPPPDTR